MPRPSYSADSASPRMRAAMRSAATAAWPSANTPAFGVPTLVTSPTAYTSGNEVSRVSGSTGIQPSTVRPDASTTAGTLCFGTPRNRSYGISESSPSSATRRAGSSPRTRVLGCQPMPRSANAASSALDASGDGGIGTGKRHDEIDLGSLAEPASREEVVHEQRGLARSGRALERRRGHRDDHPSTLESLEDVAAGERSPLCVELVASFDEPGRRGRVEIGAECDDEDVGVERARLGLDSLGGRIDRGDVRLHEPHAGLHDVGVVMVHRGCCRAAEHHLELREPEDERLGPVDEHDVDVVAELVGQPRRQLEPAEPGAQDDDPHQRWFSASSDGGLAGDAGVPHPARLGHVERRGPVHQPAVVPDRRRRPPPTGGSRCAAAGTPTR